VSQRRRFGNWRRVTTPILCLVRPSQIELHFVSRGRIDYETPEGQFIFFMEAAGNQYWGAKAKEAMRNGRRAQVASGIITGQGRARYGYYKEGKKRETHLVPVQHEVEIVRRIFAWYIDEGMSAYRIAKRLTEMRVPTPSQSKGVDRSNYRDSGFWTPEVVRRILRFEGYTGIMYMNREYWTGNVRHKIDPSE
jgi:DNA invertase Pin-like site-specific DNA recombinase